MFNFIKKFIDLFNPHSRLYVSYDLGDHDKPTIVLLHGIAATSKTWDILLEQLNTNKFRIVTLDLLGFGKSPKPKNYIYDVYDHVNSIKNTIERLDIKKPFTLVGHSMGSIIAANYACNNPNDVKELFLLSLPLYLKGDELPPSILARKKTDLFLKAYQFLSQKKNFAIKYSKKVRLLLQLDDGIDINEDNWNGFKRSLINTIVKQNTFSDIQKIHKPIHIIYGALDTLIVQANINKLAEFRNIEIIKIPNVHHLINTKFAIEVAGRIDKTLTL